MARDSVLVCTKDNCIIALTVEYSNNAEKARKILEYRNLIENSSYHDFIDDYNSYVRGTRFSPTDERVFQCLDSSNTTMINFQIRGYSFVKQPQKYKNDLSEGRIPLSLARKVNTLHFNTFVNDADVPEMFKQLGYHIEAKDIESQVRYDSSRGEYVVDNYSNINALVYSNENRLVWNRKHITYPPAEYIKIKQLIKQYKDAKRVNPLITLESFENSIRDRKDRSLFHTYSENSDSDDNYYLIVGHELKHIKNSMLLSGLSYKEEYKRPSVENLYRLMVEDERSAYLSQIINATNKYLEGGNMNDYSMFDGEGGILVSTLMRMPESERKQFVQNPKNLMMCSFESFKRYHRKNYDDGQFTNNFPIKIENMQLSAPEDTDGEYFKKAQSLLYTYEIYNPQTGRKEFRNLAQYISDDMQVEITQEVENNIISPGREELREREVAYNRVVYRGYINPDLVAEAKAMMRDRLHNPRSISQVDNVEISQLAENENYILAPQPENTNVNNEWSNNLKEYWKKEEGYQELVRNEAEYKFKVNGDTIKYTSSKKVKVNANAKYETYKKLLAEPSNKDKAIRFMDDLNKEQALILFIACVNSGRKMKGAVPQDLSGIRNLQGIPDDELRKFIRIMQARQNGNSNGNSQNPGGGRNSQSVGRGMAGVNISENPSREQQQAPRKIEICRLKAKMYGGGR